MESHSLIGRLRELFLQPPVPPGRSDPWTALACSALHAFIVTTTLWSVVFMTAVVPLFAVHKRVGWVVGAVLIAVSLVSLWLLRRGHVRAGGWCLLVTAWVVVAVVASLGGGMHGAGVVICPPLIVGAGWVLGKRVAVITGVLFVALSFTLAILDSRGDLPHYLPMPPLATWSVLVLAGGLVILPWLRVVAAMARLSEALQESQERLRSIVEAAPDAIFILNLDGRVMEVNQAAVRMLGYTREELLKLGLLDIVGEESKERTELRLAEVNGGVFPVGRARGDSEFYEGRHIRKDGTDVPVEVHARQIVYGGRPALLGIVRDTSERKRIEQQRQTLERQLQQAQKLETVGRLAGGVAHDFNNLLTVIDGYSALIAKHAAPDSTSHAHAGQIRKAAGLAAALTRQLLAFGRQQPVEFKPVDLNRLIEETAGMVERLVGDDIRVILRTGAPEGWIWADPGQVQQVLVNLAANARDATPEGGELLLETAPVSIAAERTRGPADASFPEAPAGHYIQLSVRDNGVGMDAETQRQIFEPFFTTKESGSGTGLGLATVYGIVQRCHGRIEVESEAGEGATFRILFPRGTESSAPGDGRAPIAAGGQIADTTPGPARAPAILLVEDRDDVRALTAGILELEGYFVIGCCRSEEALQVIQTRADPIDLLLTDIAMPGIDGMELAERLCERRPETKVLFASGYPDDVLAARGVANVGAAFLAKPFTAESLTATVREVLARAR